MRKVIVIGLDGLEPSIVEALMAAGSLPNLSRLAERGGYARVATTTPAQTPVAWSSFATGVNPGGHGIFDFIRRDPATYLPDLALSRYERPGAFAPPRAVNLRRGTPLWDHLGAAGIPASVLRCPCCYPPDPLRGRLLSGMGVPDLRGGLGTGTFYTTAADATRKESENLVRLPAPGPDGRFETHLVGPRRPGNRAEAQVPIVLQPHDDSRSLTIRSPGDPAELVLRQGQWSGWLRVRFRLGLLRSMRGMVRFLLVRAGPPTELELYASPVNFDPEFPPFPISEPPGYAHELARAVGLFHTTGMVEDHAGLNNGRFDEDAFLSQCDDAWNERAAMLRHELHRFTEGFLYCLFDTPDRVQHMLWRCREPDHPANRGRPPRPDLAGAIDEQYRRSDAIVGEVLDQADDETLVIALSDHGFNSFRRGVHLNGWLHDQGLLALRDGLKPGAACGEMLRDVDWSHTRAYALGLGGIYLNLRGREARGIVAPEDANGLMASIRDGLTGLRDAERGAVAVHSVATRDAVYRGPYAAESPDLVVGFAPGYRVSWSSSLGGIAEGLFEDNTRAWSGDHIIDPSHVPGVLFLSRPFRSSGASLLDLAPTILETLGVPRGAAMEGRSLFRRDGDEPAPPSDGPAGPAEPPPPPPPTSEADEALIRERLSGLGYL